MGVCIGEHKVIDVLFFFFFVCDGSRVQCFIDNSIIPVSTVPGTKMKPCRTTFPQEDHLTKTKKSRKIGSTSKQLSYVYRK